MSISFSLTKLALLAVLLVASAACGRTGSQTANADNPAAPAKKEMSHRHGSPVTGTRSLDVYGDGKSIHLLAGDYTKDGGHVPALRYRRSIDAGESWTDAVVIDPGSNAPAEPFRGVDAQIAGEGDRVAAVWTGPGTSKHGKGSMAVAFSKDGGKSWQLGPDNLGSKEGSTFLDLSINDGVFHLAWLEGGETKGTKGLRYASSADGGHHWVQSEFLDSSTCNCCWNTFAASGNRTYMLYRDAVPRDMALMVSHNNGKSWERNGFVGTFDWQIDACPHNGGGLTAVTSKSGIPMLHSVVWTGREERVGAYYLSSRDEGRTWTKPVRVGDDGAKHTDLAADPDGTLALVWDGYDKGKHLIFGSISRDSGKTWSEPREYAKGGKLATHPRVVQTKDGFTLFWTETPDDNVGIWKSVRLTDKDL